MYILSYLNYQFLHSNVTGYSKLSSKKSDAEKVNSFSQMLDILLQSVIFLG